MDMNRKFFAFDIDGTLLDSNKQPLESTIEALELLRNAGHFVTVATGRSRFHAKDIIRSLAFDNYIFMQWRCCIFGTPTSVQKIY